MRIDIAACTDRHFVMPTGVMMQSVCVNNPDVDIVFHIILDENVKAGARQDLEGIVAPYAGKSVAFYNVSEELQKKSFPRGLIYRNDITKATYYRLYFAELLPQDLDKVLYLDGDVIVRHSLLPLWNIDMGDNAVAAANDCSCGCIEYYNRLKYPFDLGYFNAGVLLVNLKYWREHQVLKNFESYMEKHADSVKMYDQDVLNVVFRNKKVYFPIKYNLQHPFLWRENVAYDYWKLEKEVLEARMDPCIIHFTSTDKPWRKYQAEPHPFSSTWYKYQDMTKWKGVKYEHRTRKQRMRRFVGNVFRMLRLLPPLQQNRRFLDVAPID